MRQTTHEINMPKIQGIERLTEIDWLKPPNIFFLIVLFVFLRIPMLFLGFGLDPDAWRIANSAFDLRYHLTYHASRFPGYPLPELVNSLLINFGWTATNSLTMLLSLLSVITFGSLLRSNGFNNKGLLTATYAFTPLLWINSTNSMEYMWALSLVMFSWFFLTRKKYIVGGIMMGLALGSRPQAIFFLVPFFFLLIANGVKKGDIFKFALSFLAVSGMLFLPLILTYGFTFIRHYPPRTTVLHTVYQAIKYFGLPSLIVLAALSITSLKALSTMLVKRKTNDMFILLAAVTVCASFAITPYHFEYLIPLIPFGLILMSRIGKKPLFILLCCCILLHSFLSVGSIQTTGTGSFRVRAVDSGAVLNNIEERREQISTIMRLSARELDQRSVVIAGPWLPIIAYLDDNVSSAMGEKRMYDSNISGQGVWNFQHNIWYRYLIDLDELNKLLKKGFKIQYIDRIREYTTEVYGYDLNEYGAVFLEIQ